MMGRMAGWEDGMERRRGGFHFIVIGSGRHSGKSLGPWSCDECGHGEEAARRDNLGEWQIRSQCWAGVCVQSSPRALLPHKHKRRAVLRV